MRVHVLGGGDRQGELEPESAAGAERAVQADPSVHRLDQAPADRQTQPGAPVAAGGGGIGLGERFEQPLVVVRGDPDTGVGDLEAHQHSTVDLAALEAGADDYLTGGGELHRVRRQVDQHLTDPPVITAQGHGDVRLAVGEQLQPLRGGRLGEEHPDLIDKPAGVEHHILEVDSARLELGEVQDVVDDPQQRTPGAMDAGGVPTLRLIQRGVQQQTGQPDHPVHRGADLVAHRRQELRLRPRRRQRLVARRRQLRRTGLDPALQVGSQGDLLVGDHELVQDHGDQHRHAVPEQERLAGPHPVDAGDGDDRGDHRHVRQHLLTDAEVPHLRLLAMGRNQRRQGDQQEAGHPPRVQQRRPDRRLPRGEE